MAQSPQLIHCLIVINLFWNSIILAQPLQMIVIRKYREMKKKSKVYFQIVCGTV